MLTAIAATCKTQPFLKITPAFLAGIVLQWYCPLPLAVLLITAAFLAAWLLVFGFLPVAQRFACRWAQGLAILLLIVLAGCATLYLHYLPNRAGWLGNHYHPGDAVCVEITAPLAEKEKTFSTQARVLAVKQTTWTRAEGKLLLYLRKDSLAATLHPGSRLLFTQPLQRIQNSGNPGAFDYKNYCALKNIYHQVFLSSTGVVVLKTGTANALQQWLQEGQQSIVHTLQRYIPGREQQGLAEALLIGYRDDLDKTLLQSYSDTGVVHIIAISGLHLGMLYGLLMSGLALLGRSRMQRLLRGCLVLAVLWLFTLLAGAAPSVLRSAVMFSFITLADVLQRKSSMYNNLAASAFCLLVYDPFCCWDAGFQLSYAAVLSIVLFRRPVYAWLTVENKLLNSIWQLLAISLAAQVLTAPLVLYYFHRFPLLFLFSNLVAVPLSGIILYGEILLLLLKWIPPLALVCGQLLGGLIHAMNWLVLQMSHLPFATTCQLQLSVGQLAAWYLVMLVAATCVLYKMRSLLLPACCGMVLLMGWQWLHWWPSQQQRKMIVYNIARTAAAEIVTGNTSWFRGDAAVVNSIPLQKNYLLPAHTCWQVTGTHVIQHAIYHCGGKRICFFTPALAASGTVPVDILIVSGSPDIAITQLQERFPCRQLVFDSSNPLWKIQKWKKDCDSLHLRFHSVPEQGAFITDL